MDTCCEALHQNSGIQKICYKSSISLKSATLLYDLVTIGFQDVLLMEERNETQEYKNVSRSEDNKMIEINILSAKWNKVGSKYFHTANFFVILLFVSRNIIRMITSY